MTLDEIVERAHPYARQRCDLDTAFKNAARKQTKERLEQWIKDEGYVKQPVSMIEGGMVHGPQGAVVGDYTSTKDNPDAIAALGRLQDKLNSING